MTVPEVMVTAADADFVGSDSNVAVTATIGGFGAFAGAVYNPLLLMLPQVEPLHPLPEILQTTSGFELPFTVAVNCNCAPGCSWADDGERVTEEAASSVIVAKADAEGSLTAVAFTNTLGGLGRLAGAVYRPADEIVPQAAPLQPAPETDHWTLVFVLPMTVAENCCCAPAEISALFG